MKNQGDFQERQTDRHILFENDENNVKNSAGNMAL